MIVLDLPYPPTLNHLYATVGRRRVLSEQGRNYHRTVAALVLSAKPLGRFTLDKRLWMEIEVYPPDLRRRDLGNLEKIVSDSITKAGLWDDDSQIDDLRLIRKPRRKGGAITVTIGEIECRAS